MSGRDTVCSEVVTGSADVGGVEADRVVPRLVHSGLGGKVGNGDGALGDIGVVAVFT